MAKVYNWQIGREMEYLYEGKRPKKQFAAVFDINRCIGCQTCTMSCKSTWTFDKGQEYMWWNNVETKPYGGYPQFWDHRILEMLGTQSWENGVYTGKTIFEARPEGAIALGFMPSEPEWRFPNIYEDTPTGWSSTVELPVHQNWMFYLQRICNHCTYPACLASCPRKAIYKREEDGIVLIDQNRCGGFKKCVEACPYKKSLYREYTGRSEKCIACYPRVEEGTIPRCVATCVGKIRLQGFLNPPEKVDPSNPIDYLVHVEKVALPLYPQFGLEPNVYYIPPRWVPRDFLTQMFGPGVEAAIRKRTNLDSTLFAVLRLFGTTQRIISKFKPTSKEVVAYDSGGNEVIRVSLEEPTYIRPFYDEKYKIHRFNEP
ncbi:4Fe-4S dicluster domain-containing protein [Candidatus Hecatella orcuttiae]|uniref:4Fe-4S dicluster domain-containing protein n=1 Tax=Candidatus Hecatella orcuttiae TaxID=1935119 RepID=UPI002867CFDE|nr:4Fe-4S dicluster domain-containing protein [Candidatus Hecatella orcuttiae]